MKRVIIICILLLSVMSITVFAAQQNQNVTILPNETKNEIFFAGGQTITNSGTVNNDIFALGQFITNDGRVNGDIFAAGQIITVGGNVNGNVRLAGSDIIVKGNTERNASIAGNNITLDKEAVVNGTMMTAGNMINIRGNIKKGLYAAGANVVIDGTIIGDTRIDAANITVTPNAKINGNLTYTSQTDANIAQGAVTGTVNKIAPVAKQPAHRQEKTFVSEIISTLLWIVGSFILGSLLVLAFKDFTQRTSESIKTSWGKYLGIGALTLIFIPIACIILLFTVIGIPISILALLGYFILMYLAKIPVSILIGDMILKDKSNAYVKLLLGLVILGIVFLVPFLGGLVHFVVILFGMGAFVYNLFVRKAVQNI